MIDVSTLSTNRGPRPTRVKMFKTDISVRGQEYCRRATLECERRWCKNKTEVINNSDIVNTDHDLLVSVLDLRTVMCPHIESTFEMPRLRQLVLDEYVKYDLYDFELQAQKNVAVDAEDVGSLAMKQKTGHGDSRSELCSDTHRPLSIGLTSGDTPPGFDWGSESEEDGDAVVVLQTPEARQLREKKLYTEAAVALKK